MKVEATSFTVLASLVFGVGVASAQGPVALVVEHEATAGAVDAAVRDLFRARGVPTLDPAAVRAARSFGGLEAALEEDGAARLREQLEARLLVWVQARPGDGDTLLVAVRLVDEGGVRSSFGSATASELPGLVVRLLEERLGSAETGRPPAAGPGVATVVPPGTSQPITASPTPVEGQPSMSASTGGAASPVSVARPAPVSTPAIAAEPTESGHRAREPEAPRERDITGARLALVGIVGVNGVGYGIGARLELPFGGVLRGTPDGLGIGVDIGATVDYEPLDASHAIVGFQVPVAVYGLWLIGVGDVVIGPRAGVMGAARFGAVEGQSIGGLRIDLVLMALVGVRFSVPIAESVSFFAGADAAIGPRFSVVLSGGISLP